MVKRKALIIEELRNLREPSIAYHPMRTQHSMPTAARSILVEKPPPPRPDWTIPSTWLLELAHEARDDIRQAEGKWTPSRSKRKTRQ